MPFCHKNRLHVVIGIFLIIMTHAVIASASQLPSFSTTKTLSAEDAFDLVLSHEPTSLKATWHIAPNHYLYQDKLHFTLFNPDQGKPFPIQNLALPPAKIIQDPFFGQQNIYTHELIVPLALKDLSFSDNKQTWILQIDYQGCAETGFCYPPQQKAFELQIAQGQIQTLSSFKPLSSTLSQALPSEADEIQHQPPQTAILDLSETLKKHHVLTAIATAYLLGILLTFTPCVLPMIPILLSVVVGQKHLNTRKAFGISLSYVLSMAFTYALAGMIAATLGKNLQARLQQPGVIISFAVLFALLALMQLGLVRIRLPHRMRLSDLFNKLHTKQESGTYLGAAVMGILATLISSPCVTLPLIGTLSYITQSGDVLLGGCVLLSMGLGMGTLLLAAGTLGGKFIPKSGPWMHTVNHAFAIMMFGLSLWLLSRVFHSAWILAFWAILALFTAWCMDTFKTRSGWSGRVGVLFVLYAITLFWGALLGEKDPMKPLTTHPWQSPTATFSSPIAFKTIYSAPELAQLKPHFIEASQPFILVFYADWCTSCQHLEHKLFSNPTVLAQLKDWQLVKANVTTYNQSSEQLLQKFDLIGPPSILFFDKKGKELTKYRIGGEISTAQFLAKLAAVEHCVDS